MRQFVTFILLPAILLTIKPISAQENDLPIEWYVVQKTPHSSELILWNPTSSDQTTLWSLESVTSETAQELFSESEINYLKRLLNEWLQGDSLSLNMLSTPANRILRRVWEIDESQLLVEIETRKCAVTTNLYCFGYYEYSVLDVVTLSLSLLATIDFHYPNVQDIACVTNVDDMTVYIHLRTFISNVRPSNNCGVLDLAEDKFFSVLINFEAIDNIRSERREATTGLSFSDSGQEMFSYSLQGCSEISCEATALLRNLDTSEQTTIFNETISMREIRALRSARNGNTFIYTGTSDAEGITFYMSTPTGSDSQIVAQGMVPTLDWRFNSHRLTVVNQNAVLILADNRVLERHDRPEDLEYIVSSSGESIIFGDSPDCLSTAAIFNADNEFSEIKLAEHFSDACISYILALYEE